MIKPINYETLIRSYINSFKYEVGNAFDLFKYRFEHKIKNPIVGVYELLAKNNQSYMYEPLALGLNALIYFECGVWTYPLPYYHNVNPGDVLYNSYTKNTYICILGIDWSSSIAGLFLINDKLDYSTIYNYDNVWSVKSKIDHKVRGSIVYVEGEKIDINTFEPIEFPPYNQLEL